MTNDESGLRQTYRSLDWPVPAIGSTAVGVLVALAVASVLLAGGAGATAEPVAECTLSEDTVYRGEAVTIDASRSTGAEVVEYDFDNDSVYERASDVGDPLTVDYDSAGTYEVTIRVENADGVIDRTTCGNVTVRPNRPPTASVTHSPSDPEVGQEVRFDAVNSRDPDGQIVRYRWDFDGDGIVDRESNDPTVAFTYGREGTKRVRVTVVDGKGAAVNATTNVSVVPRGPTPVCRLSHGQADTGQPVRVDASRSRRAERIRLDVDGDGTFDRTLTDRFSTSVSFDRPGTYTVRIEAVGDTRRKTTDCGTIRVTGEAITTATTSTTSTTTTTTSTATTSTTATTSSTTSTATTTTTTPTTETPTTETTTDEGEASTSNGQELPGFGAGSAVVAVILGLLVLARRRR